PRRACAAVVPGQHPLENTGLHRDEPSRKGFYFRQQNEIPGVYRRRVIGSMTVLSAFGTARTQSHLSLFRCHRRTPHGQAPDTIYQKEKPAWHATSGTFYTTEYRYRPLSDMGWPIRIKSRR